MKHLFKAFIALSMVAIMSCAVISVSAAEEVTTENDNTGAVVSVKDDGTKAYTLVWKYKKQNGHYYKRRWNETLGTWYDPAWILVY